MWLSRRAQISVRSLNGFVHVQQQRWLWRQLVIDELVDVY